MKAPKLLPLGKPDFLAIGYKLQAVDHRNSRSCVVKKNWDHWNFSLSFKVIKHFRGVFNYVLY
jgi:hypothetical protein